MKKEEFDPAIKELADFAVSISHPFRFSVYRFILKRWSKGQKTLNKDIVENFNYSQSTVSEHMAKLTKSGIVETRPYKTGTSYYINPAKVEKYLQSLNRLARLMTEDREK